MPEFISTKISITFLSFAHCQLCLMISHVGPVFLPYFRILCINLFDIQTDLRKKNGIKALMFITRYFVDEMVVIMNILKWVLRKSLTECFNKLLREFMESPSQEVVKVCLDWPHATCSTWTCFSRGLDWMIPRGSFQPNHSVILRYYSLSVHEEHWEEGCHCGNADIPSTS